MASTPGSSTASSGASRAGALAAPASSSTMAQASSPMLASSGDATVTSSSPTGHRPFFTGRLASLVFYPKTGSSSSMAAMAGAPASSSTMAQASSPMMAASGHATVTSSSPTGHRPFFTGGLASLVFYPKTGSSSSMAAMAGAPESLSSMASMPSGTAASSSDATFGQTRLLDPPQWTRVSSFCTSDTLPSVWAMEENPVLLGGARPDLLAFELNSLGVREVKEPGMGLDVPTKDQPMGAGQHELGNGKQPPGAGQDQQPMGAGQDEPGNWTQPMGAGQDQQPMGAGQDEPGNGTQPPGAGQDESGNGTQPPGAGQDQQPMGAGQDQLGNGKQPMGLEQIQVGRLPMIKVLPTDAHAWTDTTVFATPPQFLLKRARPNPADIAASQVHEAAEEPDSEREIHEQFWSEVGKCKDDSIVCLMCHLSNVREKNKRKLLEIPKKKIEEHCSNHHGGKGTKCGQKGCQVRAKNQGDIGAHQRYCHRTRKQ